MRMSAYPRAFALYPAWLKPLLLSLGAMFIVTALFLMILIWKSTPSSAAVAMSAAALPAASVAPPAPAPAHPSAAAPAPAREVPVAAAPRATHKAAARHHKLAHHKKSKHTKVARASSKPKKNDPLLDLLR